MGAMQMLEQLLNAGRSGSGANWDNKSLLAGGAAGGALALLLGSKRGRSIGGKALKLGSVAALGALAWQAYSRWQQQQAGAGQGSTSPTPATPAMPQAPAHVAASPGFAALPAPQMEQHSQAMLKAMIAAAKSDGHMDERERGLVESELQRLQADAATRRWFDDELRRPLDPAEVAATATSPEMAAEVYLATLLVVDDTTPMERAYLEALARELRLEPGLKRELEERAAAA